MEAEGVVVVVAEVEVVTRRGEMVDSTVEGEGEGDFPIDEMIDFLEVVVVVAAEEGVEITTADGEAFCISLPQLATG